MVQSVDFTIEQIDEGHPRWTELAAFIEAHGLQRNGVYAEKSSRCLLAASVGDRIAGFLMFLVQPIGPEAGCPVLHDRNGNALTEAKIRSFLVVERYRGRGIGTALQREALVRAADMGAYQVRSRSDVSRKANYAIKLKLGYAASPEITATNDDSKPDGIRRTQGYCFVKRTDPR